MKRRFQWRWRLDTQCLWAQLLHAWQKVRAGWVLVVLVGGTAMIYMGAAVKISDFTSLACAQSWLQPVCGVVGIDGLPSGDERVAFERAAAAGCDALYEFMQSGANEKLRHEARERWMSRKEIAHTAWAPAERRLPFEIRITSDARESEPAAQAFARQRAAQDAKQLCKLMDQREVLQLTGSTFHLTTPLACAEYDGGWVCDGPALAVCALLQRTTTVQTVCK